MAITLEEIEKVLGEHMKHIMVIESEIKNVSRVPNPDNDKELVSLREHLTEIQKKYDELHAEYLKLKPADDPTVEHHCHWCQ